FCVPEHWRLPPSGAVKKPNWPVVCRVQKNRSSQERAHDEARLRRVGGSSSRRSISRVGRDELAFWLQSRTNRDGWRNLRGCIGCSRLFEGTGTVLLLRRCSKQGLVAGGCVGARLRGRTDLLHDVGA